MKGTDVDWGKVYVIQNYGSSERWLARINIHNGDGFWNVTPLEPDDVALNNIDIVDGLPDDETKTAVVESREIVCRATPEIIYEMLKAS